MSLVAKLSASSLIIVGAVYVMGYVVVNGYQTKYMNYNANALQLKHLTAGMLYSFLTFFQVAIVASFLLSAILDVKIPSKSDHGEAGLASAGSNTPGLTSPPAKGTRWQRLFARAKSIGHYCLIFGKSLVIAYVIVIFMFFFLGMSISPSGGWLLMKSMIGWSAINLLLSVMMVVGFYVAGNKSFQRALPGKKEPEETSSLQASVENETVSTEEVESLQRTFIRSHGGRVAAPLLALALLLISLVSFQGLYGRIMPDYGGGALYRVAVHLKPAGSTPAPAPGSAIADWKENFKSKKTLTLLVDNDGAFVYILCVDRDGNKQLLGISQSEIEALEILSTPPISPVDVPFFIE